MTDPFDSYSQSTAPATANPDGSSVYSPKVLGQQAVIRQEISRYATIRIGFQIYINDALGDPDPGSVQALVYKRTNFNDSNTLGDLVPTPPIDHEDIGVFSMVLGPEITDSLGHITIQWTYLVDGETYEFWDYYQIREQMPIYDTLSENERGIVSMVNLMFADLYDSVDGGPHLKEEFQTHFGTETIARCLVLAGNRLNTTSQPYTSYVVGDGYSGQRFPQEALPLLIQATYLEVLRHLVRSYVEQPNVSGGPGVAFLDRRDYMDRWRTVLNDEKEDFEKAVRSFKRGLLGLGGGSLIVAGGIFGAATWFKSGMYAMQARGARFMYPISTVIVRS